MSATPRLAPDAIDFAFVKAGSDALPTPGRVYVDVGNRFADGVLDHHAPGTPAQCSAQLALDHLRHVWSQVGADGRVTILTHEYPDMDAVSGIYFARAHLLGEPLDAAARAWAGYACAVDRGYTRLDPSRPVRPYSVFMLHLRQASEGAEDAPAASRRSLQAGLWLVHTLLAQLRRGIALDDPAIVAGIGELDPSVQAVRADHAAYLRDLLRADCFHCRLPRADGRGLSSVPGIWIDRPRAALFKSWARGDRRAAARPDGFVFTGVQLSDERAILSVAPGSGVTLRGLGDRLEAAETRKRARLGRPRTGEHRPGYDAPDPWYDGRAPLHAYTIVDAPRAGTVLTAAEIRATFDQVLMDWAERDKREGDVGAP